MTKSDRPNCPECRDTFEYPEPALGRRGFLVAAAAGVAAASVGSVRAVRAAAPPTPRPAEDQVRELFAALASDQKKRLVLPYDHGGRGNPTRRRTANSALMNLRIGDVYTGKQQELIERIIKATCSGEEGYRQISRLGRWDTSGGMKGCGALFFGEPTEGNKFAFLFTGHHLTARCDGDSEEGPAFGGPIYYGHSPNGWSRGNVFNYQSRAVLKLWKALSGKQQQLATVTQRAKGERDSSVQFRGEKERPGIPASELTRDQRQLAEEVMRTVLAPYRKEDVDEVMQIVKTNGGMDRIKFAFYPEGPKDEKEPWRYWRLEGPGFVWNYRVLPHVHTYVSISSKLS